MPTTDVKKKQYVQKTDINQIVTDISNPNGILMYKGAYSDLKAVFRAHGLENHVVEADPDTGFYNVSEWRPTNGGGDVAIRVTYRVPMYTNSRGREVRGVRLEISA